MLIDDGSQESSFFSSLVSFLSFFLSSSPSSPSFSIFFSPSVSLLSIRRLWHGSFLFSPATVTRHWNHSWSARQEEEEEEENASRHERAHISFGQKRSLPFLSLRLLEIGQLSWITPVKCSSTFRLHACIFRKRQSMCEQTKRYFSPRLLDYVIVVGCRHPNKHNHITQTSELLRRYPLEDHKDFALPPDVIFFCQPEGCINTGHQRTAFRQITSFVFTLTEKDSNRQRFGICVNFYRHFSRRTSSPSNPNIAEQTEGEDTDGKRKRRLRNNTLTSICLISHHPFFTRFRECLVTLKEIIDACNERANSKRAGATKGTPK